MPEPVIHATTAVIKYGAYGCFGAAVALLFDVPPDVVITSLVGSIFAVMMLHAFSFKVAAFVVMAGTFGAASAAPFISDTYQKGIGFFTAFCLIYFWGVIKEAVKKVLASKIEGLGK